MPLQKTTTPQTLELQDGKKLFTVDEANRALCYIDPIVNDLTCCYRKLVEYRRQLDQAATPAATEQAERKYEKAMDCLSNYVDELQHVGVELKDFEKGLVDFPAMHDGREIHLCWQIGESNIVAWHETKDGFADRQPVDTLVNCE